MVLEGGIVLGLPVSRTHVEVRTNKLKGGKTTFKEEVTRKMIKRVGRGSSFPTILKHKYQLEIVHYIRRINVLILKKKISETLPLKFLSRLINLVIFQGKYKKGREWKEKERKGSGGV